MKLSFRKRILLTLLPSLGILAVLGGTAIVLLYRLGNRIDEILRENYDSVEYMQDLREAVERIDSSFQFAMAGQEEKAREDYGPKWEVFRDRLAREWDNITLPGEREKVEELDELATAYRKRGDAFFTRPAGAPQRRHDYFGKDGLLDHFRKIKTVSADIMAMNQRTMEEAEAEARRASRDYLVGFAVGLAVAVALAGWLAWTTIQATVRPIQSVTRSALAIGQGDLDQVVPVRYGGELAQLAEAFNTMARQLREYRRSDLARLHRAQQTSQATVDSFPDPVLVADPGGHPNLS